MWTCFPFLLLHFNETTVVYMDVSTPRHCHAECFFTLSKKCHAASMPNTSIVMGHRVHDFHENFLEGRISIDLPD